VVQPWPQPESELELTDLDRLCVTKHNLSCWELTSDTSAEGDQATKQGKQFIYSFLFTYFFNIKIDEILK
jgi:hypothetical protein